MLNVRVLFFTKIALITQGLGEGAQKVQLKNAMSFIPSS